ncbi:hypothetical protein HNO53_12985 [Billgrantia antri]|uniref:Uncharacterized protein n=1 Tax=Halomonas sulfidivorans TaxID=2733488 RepID=A0ABX7WI13_9GAMM|nr:hypothetical protein [Halomonas sulfidivorans]QTP59550.1 hypothetical protein HNO53_12985 [Halomonas sulfidivorans]
MAKKLELTKAKINKLAKLITEYPQQEAAALAGIPPRSYSRYKAQARDIFDAVMDEEVEESELTKKEKLLLEFFIVVDMGVPLHVGKYLKIMRDTAIGRKWAMDEDGNYILNDKGKRIPTDWVPAKEYAHMLTFATKEAREEREQESGTESGVIGIPTAQGQDLAALIKQQQAYTQSLAQAKRQENGDDD